MRPIRPPRLAGWTGGRSLGERVRGWMLPLTPTDIGAGAALVTAAAIKASGGVLIPVVLAGLLKTPRRFDPGSARIVLGVIVSAAAPACSPFGLHIPDLSTQSWLVTSTSVPNLDRSGARRRRGERHVAHRPQRRCSW